MPGQAQIQVGAIPEAVTEIHLCDLRVAPWNARKSFDPVRLAELESSISLHGIQIPLMVRRLPIDSANDVFEIIAGDRRYKVATKLAKASAPCIIRALDDDQAREIGLVDNLQREDVPALEEADAYHELQQRLGTPAAIAARVGKDVSYVARRLQLVSLAELPRKALAERLITVDHALLLARLGSGEQDENLKWALDTNAGVKTSVDDVIAACVKERDRKTSGWQSYFEPESALELRNHIEQNVGRKLSRAPWKLDDAALVAAAGACDVCPSNTKANDTLFGDLNIQAATCENGRCFEEKRAAFVRIQIGKAAIGVSQPPLLVSWKISAAAPRPAKDGSGPNGAQTFRLGQWMDVKKGSCEHTRIAVTVDWSDAGNRGYMGTSEKIRKPGQVLLVCVTPKCKAHPKTYEKVKSKSDGGGYDAKAEETKAEETKAAAIAESKIRLAVASKALEGIKTLPDAVLRALVSSRIPDWAEDRKPMEALVPGLVKTVREAKVDSIAFAQAAAIASIDHQILTCGQYQDPKASRGYFLAAIKQGLGYDGSNAWLKPAAPKPEKKATAKPAAKKAAKKKGRK